MPSSDAYFKKGNKAGIGAGRPKGSFDIARQCQAHGPDVVKFLWSVLQDMNASLIGRIKAAEILLDRGFGKPLQRSEGGEDIKETTIIIIKDSGQGIVSNPERKRTISLNT